MITTKSYDSLNRLTNILWSTNSVAVASFAYGYNAANQRTTVALADGAYWAYTYDNLGQVVSGKKYWADGTPVAGQQFVYGFDDIGNRQTAASGGDSWGASLRYQNYSANSLNQYVQRTVPGFAAVLGTAASNASVTLWTAGGSYAPALRKGDYFRAELPVNNSTGAVWLTLTNLAVLNDGSNPDIVASTVGQAFLPRTPEAPGYDADGNLTQDGRWTYSWDAENRLINLTSLSNAPTGSKLQLNFLYDSQGRRIQKIVSTNNGSAYYFQSTNRFVYDGWNLMAVLNPQSALVRSFVWGLDLSGSLQGAGGVGGLLEINDAVNGVQFAAYDGNGNVGDLVGGAGGTTTAQYEYGPFGEVLRITGPMAKANPFRFSTKYQDDETDLLYYGFRYYNASTGRWLSRDPIEEGGGFGLYVLVANQPVNRSDRYGLDMVLREHFWMLFIPPAHGTNAGLLGLTWFQAFAPQTAVYNGLEGPCCWKIMLSGYADLYSWWVKDAFAPDGTSAKDHEMRHVGYGRDAFKGYVASASDYTGVCFSKPKANCFASVITGILVAAYGAHYDTQNMQLDFEAYGKYRDEIPAQQRKEDSLWHQLSEALQRCANMP
ncbi:MAG: RHS repeat-associated core domain-containing protein [Limisphaerales bacterium]